MSVNVEPSALADHLADFGPIAYLVTVGPSGRPHVVSVRPELDGQHVRTGAGRTTLANVGTTPEVTILWPAPPGGGYGLIVDGLAVALAGDDGPVLEIRPGSAVLHRTPEGDPAGPTCATVVAGA